MSGFESNCRAQMGDGRRGAELADLSDRNREDPSGTVAFDSFRSLSFTLEEAQECCPASCPIFVR